MGYNTLGLQYAENDLKLIQNALTLHEYATYTPGSSEDKKTALLSALDDFLDSCSSSDTVIIYFSGHAFAPKGELLLLLDENLKRLNTSTIQLSYLTAVIENCSARNKLLILDCCHALSEISDWRPPQSEVYRILASSGRLEKAKEMETFCASFLSYQIYRALTECYSDLVQDDVPLTINKLYGWLFEQAKSYNSNHTEMVPLPKLMGDQGNDFVLCALKEPILPLQIRKFLIQLSSCLAGCCYRECFGRYPWCRIFSELGLISSIYVIPHIKCSTDKGIISTQRLDKYFLEWIKSEKESHLAILGDSGIGKSSACLFFTSRLADDCLSSKENGLIPIFLSLEGLAMQGLLGKEIAIILREVLHIDLDQSVIDGLVRDNRFVFILDGFDEVSDRADHARIIKNLDNLKPFLLSGCKSILTCRTHFFVNQEQVEQVLVGGSNVGTELYEALREQSQGFRLIELQEFSDEEIRELIKKKQSGKQEEIWNTIKGLYNLEDLSRRPILLSLILQTLPSLIRRKSEINRAEIYKAYIDYWLKREAARVESDIDITKKERFIEHLAMGMWKRTVGSINYKELQEEIRRKYAEEIDSITDLYARYYDTQNASFLNRDNDGFYRFMHKSFMEYFVAQSCVRSLRRNGNELSYWEIKWFDKEVAGFISEILQQTKYSSKIEILTNISLTTSQRTILWNTLHVLSLIKEKNFFKYAGQKTLNKVISRAELEQNAVILRQHCRIIAKFCNQNKARELIIRIIDIVSNDEGQNIDNNETYINYYYGRSSACEALLGHLSTIIPKYDRELHIYVLGEIGEERHAERLLKLAKKWKNTSHIQMAHEAILKISRRENR